MPQYNMGPPEAPVISPLEVHHPNDGRCAWCGGLLGSGLRQPSRDHLIPKSFSRTYYPRAGDSSWVHKKRMIVLSCYWCNNYRQCQFGPPIKNKFGIKRKQLPGWATKLWYQGMAYWFTAAVLHVAPLPNTSRFQPRGIKLSVFADSYQPAKGRLLTSGACSGN